MQRLMCVSGLNRFRAPFNGLLVIKDKALETGSAVTVSSIRKVGLVYGTFYGRMAWRLLPIHRGAVVGALFLSFGIKLKSRSR